MWTGMEIRQKPLSTSSRDLSNRGTWDPALQLAGGVGIALVSLPVNQKEKSCPIAGEQRGKIYSRL